MAFEVHGGVEHTDDLQRFVFATEKNDVPTFGGETTARKEIFSEAEGLGCRADGFDPLPSMVEIALFLLRAPGFKGIGSDCSAVIKCGLGENEFHALPRSRLMKCFSDFTSTVCPASSWAKPMEASRTTSLALLS